MAPETPSAAAARVEAARLFAEAVQAVGGQMTQRLDPSEEPEADVGHVNCTMRVEFPNGKRYWIEVECEVDE